MQLQAGLDVIGAFAAPFKGAIRTFILSGLAIVGA